MKPKTAYQRHVRRSFGFGLLGVFLMATSGYLLYVILQDQPFTFENEPSTYDYTIKQSVDSDVKYVNNSFFDDGPAQDNDAFVRELTDKVSVVFHYDLQGSESIPLSYTYDVKAVIRATYSLQGDEKDTSNVWTREFQLFEPTTQTLSTQDVTLDPAVDIDFAKYSEIAEQFRTALALPSSSEVVVTATVSVTGETNGSQFTDTKTAVVSAPLDQQIYKLAVKYEKETTGQVVAQKTKDARRQMQQYQALGAVALGLLGLGAFVYGIRKRIFKTQYQRELERIYRYHDGIIIRASRSPDLRHKSEVQVDSFDDMLNLEEELKAPIVAVSTGNSTRFMVIRDDIVYVYQLGDVPRENRKSLEQIANSVKISDVSAPTKRKK